MPVQKYIRQSDGVLHETVPAVTSAGSGDDGRLVALDPSGRLDESVLPVGIGADTAIVQASEALAAGDLVNVHAASGSFRARKADASTAGKEAHGFVLAAFGSGAEATVYMDGTNTQVTGATPGVRYLSTTPGLSTTTAPTGTGEVVQRIGVAVAADQLSFEPGQPVVLA
ncbi:MAG: hypothetical protein QM621_08660 [Aeromicrobium sp.]|uniref:hypothetical protein n=1 Tax=Aeromicrobium sp. TaxID=1871063 RepID=UPI0039E6947B